ncbi:hypothetical protein QC763_100300 [Podospora pseudopauciseta]|uniref:Uncharacterized protein n=1 Tax=Podospora pseudopauciseta TaxID=2093780 RepID=A0ABR0HVL2_9PEZI|nr:hypothetical protein QC763_100300 [Podospora pseudopauciseta]
MSAMADTSGLHRCSVCFKTYKRREHLQRHRGTHTSERPHRCILCNAAFQRTDVLKRHLQTCDGAANSSSGRRRACDRCVRQKKACNSGQPCLNCEKRGVECTYGGSAGAGASNGASNSAAPLPAPPVSAPGPPSILGETSSAPPPLPPIMPQLPPVPAPIHHHHHHHQTFDDASSAIVSTHGGSMDDGTASTFDDVPYDDLDALIHQAVTTFPVLDGHHSMPDGWLDIDFSHQPNPGGHDGLTEQDHQAEAFQRELSPSSTTSEYRGYSFGFLYDFTSRTGLVSSFECATLAQRHQIVAAFHNSYLERQHPEFLGAVPPLFMPLDDPTAAALTASGVSGSNTLSSWSLWLHNPIVIKLQQVVLLIKNVVTVKPNNSTVTLTWSAALEQQCLQFFSPSRFARFIELYWSVWHPNVNILHRPTFDPTTCKSILLAAMALIDPADNEDAKVWFNCVEEMVFTDDDFCRDIEPSTEVTSPTSVLASRRKLQALQASYIVCLYQNWEGTDAGKRRIRRHRFSTVVSVARDLGIDIARHPDYSRQFKHDFNWMEFVVREELIRTFLWIFLVDTAFVIFNNLPHRMVIKEMKMHMASPEVCFQAASAEACLAEIHRWMPPSSPFGGMLLRDAIEQLCIGPMSPEMHRHFSHLGPVNLFATVSAIHYMIFQHQNLFGVEGQLIPIRNALDNWITIWERCFDMSTSCWPHGLLQDHNLPPEMLWKRIGFVRFSAEYWLLGSLLTNRLSATISKPMARHPHMGASPPEQYGDQGVVTKPARVEPILDKYDQTSMRQVNDLITDFQKFNIE